MGVDQSSGDFVALLHHGDVLLRRILAVSVQLDHRDVEAMRRERHPFRPKHPQRVVEVCLPGIRLQRGVELSVEEELGGAQPLRLGGSGHRHVMEPARLGPGPSLGACRGERCGPERGAPPAEHQPDDHPDRQQQCDQENHIQWHVHPLGGSIIRGNGMSHLCTTRGAVLPWVPTATRRART